MGLPPWRLVSDIFGFWRVKLSREWMWRIDLLLGEGSRDVFG